MPKSVSSFKKSDSLHCFFILGSWKFLIFLLSLLHLNTEFEKKKKSLPFPICDTVAITNAWPLYQPLGDVLLISEGLVISVILNDCIRDYREFKRMFVLIYIDYCMLLSTSAVNFMRFLHFMIFHCIFHLQQSLLIIFFQSIGVWIWVIHERQKY